MLHTLINSAYNGTEIISFLGPKIWNILVNEIKEMKKVGAFKSAIKKLKLESCPYRPGKHFKFYCL